MPTLIAFVIHYCAYCDMFKEQAMPNIIASNDYEVVVWNASVSKFEHGSVPNIEQYKKLVRGYPTFIVVKDGEVVNTWEGFDNDYQFWLEYNQNF